MLVNLLTEMTKGLCPDSQPAQSGAAPYLCQISLFCTYQLNFASGLILVVIATSRLIKATSYGVTGTCAGKCLRTITQTRCWSWVHGVSTVRGAKVACVVAFFASLFITWPCLLIYFPYHSPAGNSTSTRALAEGSPAHMNTSLSTSFSDGETPTSASAVFLTSTEGTAPGTEADLLPLSTAGEPATMTSAGLTGAGDSECEQATRVCDTPVHPNYVVLKQVIDIIYVISFVTIVASLVVVYSFVLQLRRRLHFQQQLSDDCSEPAMPMTSVMTRMTSRDDSGISCDGEATTNAVAFRASENVSHDLTGHGGPTSISSTTTTTTAPKQESGKKATGTTLTFFFVTVVFVVSYLPHLIVELSATFSGSLVEAAETDPTLRAVVLVMGKSYLLTNAFNPFIYGVCDPRFRNQLWNVLKCHVEYI